MSLHDSAIIQLAHGLLIGMTRSVRCVSCLGGQSGERSFNVTREPGSVVYCCHRASCGLRGAIGAVGGGTQTAPPAARPYMGPLGALPTIAADALADKYGISREAVLQCIKYAENSRYGLPVFGPDGLQRAIGIRWPWGMGPPTDGKPKYQLFLDTPDTVSTAWYGRGRLNDHCTVLLVEDQLSALRACNRGQIRTVALLGTDLSAVKVAELQRHTRNIVIALDADATDKAFKLAQTWGAAFDTCQVCVLTQDLKDMPADELDTLLRRLP